MKNKILTGIIIGGTVLATTGSAFAMGPQGSGQGLRTGGGYGGDNPNREALEEAFSNNDYQAWYDITVDSPRGEEVLSIITEENFASLVEAHNLRHDGDMEGAKAIMEELGMPEQGNRGEGFGGGEHAQAMKDALDNNDYSAWLKAIADAPNYDEMTATINESNFDQLVAAHNLMQEKDIEGAKAIFDELGLEMPMGPKGERGGMGGEIKDLMEQAASGTYDQFVELIKDLPMADKLLEEVTADNFDQFVAMHNLMQEGNFDEAKAIADELGFKGPQGGDHKPGKIGKRTGDRANRMSDDGSVATPAVA